ncbi:MULTISPECIES: MFS transporter [Vitreoscilla]|uniref:Aromatic acid/H+ symport family MFS transporter n=1 Tax=Vitreoscilla stercoraria TaxID=61 RepID=A0ABY4ED05_VITST|nr:MULTISPECIES: aromatic acid/H+ symport family MFS transporter [Vitreoscilla]QJQ52244.1 4-hydroxybenzoate transporter PcaK [Vitreoscilla sp. C1]UOO93623.1 aromatic acid/H+ symport family MFS transporter [Vitreoscilla stercoraria]
MNNQNVIDVREVINAEKISGLQKLVVFFCCAIIAIDGFDVVVMGLSAPQIIQEWGVSATDMGPVLSAALFGLAIGALTAGPLSDRFGRKWVLIISVFFFGLMTLVTAFAQDVTQLVIFRFLTGLGLGAAAPNAATLAAEYAPVRRRAFFVTIAYAGFSLGAAGGGFISAWMIPEFGWRSVFVLGGILPLVLLPFMILKMPESLSFLVAKKGNPKTIRSIVNRMIPNTATEKHTYTVGPIASKQKSALGIVMSKEYRLGTYMLWLSYFTALFLIYLCSSWLPTIIKMNDFTISQAAIVTSIFQIGGPIGSLFFGWAMDKFKPHAVLISGMLVGAAATYALGQFGHNLVLLSICAWILGFCFNGGSVGMSALATNYYPTEARATGASWMNGIGRFGAILSAFAGGYMITQGYSLQTMFTLLMIPALLAGLAIFIKGAKAKEVSVPSPVTAQTQTEV